MIIIKDFKSKDDKTLIIADMKAQGAVLVAIQNHFDGNHLVFESLERDPLAEIDALTAKLKAAGIAIM